MIINMSSKNLCAHVCASKMEIEYIYVELNIFFEVSITFLLHKIV